MFGLSPWSHPRTDPKSEVTHFATNAADFSISTLVLQKQHSFKHKRRFSQVDKHKIRSKPFYTQILSYDTSFNIAEQNLSH